MSAALPPVPRLRTSGPGGSTVLSAVSRLHRAAGRMCLPCGPRGRTRRIVAWFLVSSCLRSLGHAPRSVLGVSMHLGNCSLRWSHPAADDGARPRVLGFGWASGRRRDLCDHEGRFNGPPCADSRILRRVLHARRGYPRIALAFPTIPFADRCVTQRTKSAPLYPTAFRQFGSEAL